MKKYAFILAACIAAPALLTSCKQAAETSAVVAPAAGAKTAPSMSDVTGTYSGSGSCEPCRESETTVALDKDGTFLMVEKPRSGKAGKEIRSTGKWILNGNEIEMLNAPDVKQEVAGDALIYRWKEGSLIQISMSGNPIEGERADEFALKKKM